MSDVHECAVCTQLSLLAVQQSLPGCEVSHDLVVILSTDSTPFWAISSTSGFIKQVELHSVHTAFAFYHKVKVSNVLVGYFIGIIGINIKCM